MWLLSTARAELHYFPSPEEVPDGYAALSHVWDKTEQSFQDVRRIRRRCTKEGTNPRDSMCEKIRRCCELAESHGYKWVWIDTCCIDKTSSTELAEAINSMYRYYSLARICYGYLRDVGRPQSGRQTVTWRKETFLRSVWFQRGWTLQELIAPRFFLFVSKSWQRLGSKADFASYLQTQTGIPAAVLRFEVSHTTYSISQRMSWFGSRKTTRVEDQAYCLLGLFDVHMAPLYGEGRNAFQRLQEEIMKQSVDTTIFAWGYPASADDPVIRSCLLAPSPSAFETNRVACIPLAHVWRLHLPTHLQSASKYVERDVTDAQRVLFSVTPRGILAYIPIIPCRSRTYADLFWCSEPRAQASPDHYVPTYRVLLCLEEDPDSQAKPSSLRKSYIVCPSRLVRIDPPKKSLKYIIAGRMARGCWQTVLIRHRPPQHRLPGQPLLADPRAPFIPATPAQLVLNTPFRFDEARVQKFLRACGANKMNIQHSLSMTAYVFAFESWSSTWVIVIRVGHCGLVARDLDVHPPPPLPQATIWATVTALESTVPMSQAPIKGAAALSTDHKHVCPDDHVSSWLDSRKRFDLGTRFADGAAVVLAFTPCPINPGRTVILDAIYRGRIRSSTAKRSVRGGRPDKSH